MSQQGRIAAQKRILFLKFSKQKGWQRRDRKTLETPYPRVFHYHPGVKLFVSEVLDIHAIAAIMAEFSDT